MVQVVFHEAFGHLGLRLKKGGKSGEAFSADYKDMINGYKKTAKKDILAWLDGPLGEPYIGQKYSWEQEVEGEPTFKQTEEYP